MHAGAWRALRRVVQADPAFLNEGQQPSGDDRFGDRGDAEDRVSGHRCTVVGVERPGGLDLHMISAGDESHRSR
jgi:hypothetical protein